MLGSAHSKAASKAISVFDKNQALSQMLQRDMTACDPKGCVQQPPTTNRRKLPWNRSIMGLERTVLDDFIIRLERPIADCGTVENMVASVRCH